MDHRPQLHDDINDGKVKLKDLDKDQLKGLTVDFTMDYQPSEPFVTRARLEFEGRQLKLDDAIRLFKEARAKKKINTNFF